MSTFWKVMVGLLLTLPLGAYFTGTMLTSEANLPRERPPVVISDNASPGAQPSKRPEADKTGGTPADGPQSSRPPSPAPSVEDDDDDDEVPVVRPTPRDVEDDDNDDGDDGGDDDGGGDDDREDGPDDD